MLALSTSWNNSFSRSGTQVIGEIGKLGFQHVELAFSHTKRQLSQILGAKDIGVASLHNYCPIPDGIPPVLALPDCYSLSSGDNNERKRAVKFTKRTIQTAAQCKAKAVVIHCGRVQTRDYTKQLITLKQKAGDKKAAKQFEALKSRAIEERRQKKSLFLDRILSSLKELSSYAYNEGIVLGVENRIYIREIPDFLEVRLFLQLFAKKGVRYWHDTGHAYVMDKLRLGRHLEYLENYGEHLAGIHLHDVEGFQDHKAPFTGEIDFSAFRPFIKKDTIQVIEAHKPATAKQIIASREKLEKLFGGQQ